MTLGDREHLYWVPGPKDPAEHLASVLSSVEAKVGYDPEASIYRPCVGCGCSGPNGLKVVGAHVTEARPREPLRRPMCDDCWEAIPKRQSIAG